MAEPTNGDPGAVQKVATTSEVVGAADTAVEANVYRQHRDNPTPAPVSADVAAGVAVTSTTKK